MFGNIVHFTTILYQLNAIEVEQKCLLATTDLLANSFGFPIYFSSRNDTVLVLGMSVLVLLNVAWLDDHHNTKIFPPEAGQNSTTIGK